jgi:hypothetical protein
MPQLYAQTRALAAEKLFVTAFLQNAESILETAQGSGEGTNWTILTGGPGGIRMIADSDWPLDSLQAHTGAAAAYRVHRRGGEVMVEGRSAHQALAVRSTPPAQVARFLLGARG